MPAGASAPVMPARASSVGEMSTFVAGAAHSDPGLIPGPRATTAQVPGTCSQNPKVHGQQKEGTGRTVDPDIEVVHVALVLGQVQLAELETVITCTSAAWLLSLALAQAIIGIFVPVKFSTRLAQGLRIGGLTRVEEVSVVRLPELVDGLDRVLDGVVHAHERPPSILKTVVDAGRRVVGQHVLRGDVGVVLCPALHRAVPGGRARRHRRPARRPVVLVPGAWLERRVRGLVADVGEPRLALLGHLPDPGDGVVPDQGGRVRPRRLAGVLVRRVELVVPRVGQALDALDGERGVVVCADELL